MTAERMEAGAALDALVYVGIMSGSPIDFSGQPPCPKCRVPMVMGTGRAWCLECREWFTSPYPEYSTSIEAAWTIVEAMRAKGFGCHITAVSNLNRTEHFWAVDFSNPTTERSGQEHDTHEAPHAIALAALAALQKGTP